MIAWFGLWSVMIQRKFTPGIISGELEDKNRWIKFARVGITLLAISPWLAFGVVMIRKEHLSDWLEMFLGTIVPSFGLCLGLFFYSDWINVKIGLLKMTNESDFSIDSHKKVVKATLSESFREDIENNNGD